MIPLACIPVVAIFSRTLGEKNFEQWQRLWGQKTSKQQHLTNNDRQMTDRVYAQAANEKENPGSYHL